MNIKTMEGLVGAHTSMNIAKVPVRVYMEARRRGDSGTMERAMGYAGEFADRAKEYQAKADEGMEEEAREAREREKLEQEEAIAKRRMERKIQESEADKMHKENADTVEVSEEGRKLLEQGKTDAAETDGKDHPAGTGSKAAAGQVSTVDLTNVDSTEGNINGIMPGYTATGKSIPPVHAAAISIAL